MALFGGRFVKSVGSLSRRVVRRQSHLHRCCISFATTKSLHTSEKVDKDLSFLVSLPWQFLRRSNLENFDDVTSQRKDVVYDHNDGKPHVEVSSNTRSSKLRMSIESISTDENEQCKISWSDGSQTLHNVERLKQQYLDWQRNRSEDRILWENMKEEDVRTSSLSLSFDALIAGDDSGMKQALSVLYRYGILLITNTPVDDHGAGIAALGAALSGGSVKDNASSSLLANYRIGGNEVVLPDGTDGPLRTLYGGVWATTSVGQPEGTSVADSAYGSDALPLHTDSTYLQDPPGLQIFTMVQPATVGGESVFCDGFAIAEELRSRHPKAFDTLTDVKRTFHSKDETTGWHLRATGPVIEELNGRVVRIRHNDLDRLPDLPPKDLGEEEIDSFYNDLERAHANWDSLIAQDRYRLVMKLRPGDTMVVANQRCLHGRYKFKSTAESPRSVMGCYISQDELSSRFRMEGFDV